MDDGTLVVAIVGAVLGGVVGAVAALLTTSWQVKKRAKQELQSLILVFCSEFVLAFERCVTFYEQLSKSNPSLAGLFQFTDATMLSRLTSVCKDPEVARAIIVLKNSYYQIGRHIDAASEMLNVAEINAITRDGDPLEITRDDIWAHQRTALGFFNASYNAIDLETRRVISATKEYAPGDSADDWERRFNKRWQDYKNLIASATREG